VVSFSLQGNVLAKLGLGLQCHFNLHLQLRGKVGAWECPSFFNLLLDSDVALLVLVLVLILILVFTLSLDVDKVLGDRGLTLSTFCNVARLLRSNALAKLCLGWQGHFDFHFDLGARLTCMSSL
jgi:hypothetical protein